MSDPDDLVIRVPIWDRPAYSEVAPYHSTLMQTAWRHLGEQQYMVAILIAQTAAEVYIEQAWTTVFARKLGAPVDELLDLVTDRTFYGKRTRKLWRALTGDMITEPQGEWERFRAHVDLRNHLIHGGTARRCGEEEAKASLDAVEEFIGRMERVVKPLREHPPDEATA